MTATKENPKPTQTETADQFPDLNKLRLSQEFLETAGAKKLLTTVPVRKPRKQDFIRVHAEAGFRGAFAIIELVDDRESYLVTPDIAAASPTEVVMTTIYAAINRQRVVFLLAGATAVIGWPGSRMAPFCARGRRTRHDALGARYREHGVGRL